MTSLTDLTDEKLFDIFAPEITPDKRALETVPSVQFDTSDLVGKTIAGIRYIASQFPYHPEVECRNPEYFQILLFTDNTALLFENWANPNENHLNAYYFDGKEVLFSDELFDPDTAHLREHF